MQLFFYFYKIFKAYNTDNFTKYSCHQNDGIKRFAAEAKASATAAGRENRPTANIFQQHFAEKRFNMLNKIALVLLIIDGLNWGLVGIFEFDLVAWLFGGATSLLSRIVYVLVALSAIWCIGLLFKDDSSEYHSYQH